MIKRLLPLIALPLGLFACEEGGNLTGVFPRMILTPQANTTLDFSEVVLGGDDAEPLSILIESQGDTSLEVSALQVEPEAFNVTDQAISLAPGQSREIRVRFTPSEPGPYQGSLQILSNDREQPTATFPLAGSARERCALSMAPTHQQFSVGEIREVTIRAESSEPCEIIRISLDRTLFRINGEPELPFTLLPGETFTFAVEHHTQSTQPGLPTRELRLKESEGAEVFVTLEGEPPVQDCLRFMPEERMIFPTTPIGQVIRQPVLVSNQCATPARVISAVIGTGYSFTIETIAFPIEIPGQGSTEIMIAYDPANESGDRGLLNINTNDANAARVPIELNGQASKPKIQVFPQVVDFGRITLRNPQGTPPRSACGANTQTVQLYSVGDADITIERVELEAGDDLFEITGMLIDGRPVQQMTNVTLPANKEGRLDLKFYPSRLTPATHETALLVHHSAEGSPSRVILRGEAMDDVRSTESFTQPTGPKLDVLWVIQNTFLADDEHRKLAGYIDSFIDVAESANADYHMAVTVTDSRSPSAGSLERCFPHPAQIRSTYSTREDRVEALSCTVTGLGVNGSFLFVSGLGAAMRAIERAIDIDGQDPQNNSAAGFIRPDAKLMVIILSTRDDDSVESNALLRDYLLSVKGAHRPERMVVHALAGPVLGPCENQPFWFVWPGYRYFWMTRETGGLFYDVCEENWQPFFDQIGLDAFTPIDEWDLTGAADPSTMSVLVNGSTVTPSMTDGYTFLPQSNSVRFHGSAVPAPGAQVEVSYGGACRP